MPRQKAKNLLGKLTLNLLHDLQSATELSGSWMEKLSSLESSRWEDMICVSEILQDCTLGEEGARKVEEAAWI